MKTVLITIKLSSENHEFINNLVRGIESQTTPFHGDWEREISVTEVK